MPQFFPRGANTIVRLFLFGLVIAVAFALWLGQTGVQSPYETRQNIPRQQPIPFSHEHHVGGLGIDCRYCHTTVETSPFAGVPATKICLNCHSQIWAVAPVLQLVRESYRTGRSIAWNRVNDLPDFTYFNHAIHVNKGFGCETCHGRVDRMPLTWQARSLQMNWCLDCHRHPEQYVRPQDRVFDMSYKTPPNQAELGRRLVREYKIQSLTSCSTCHR
jgi:hypothetical protein